MLQEPSALTATRVLRSWRSRSRQPVRTLTFVTLNGPAAVPETITSPPTAEEELPSESLDSSLGALSSDSTLEELPLGVP